MPQRQTFRLCHVAAILVAASCCADVVAEDAPLSPVVLPATDAGRDLYDVAAEHLQAGRWSDAATALQKFVTEQSTDPRIARGQLLLGEALVRSGHTADAVAPYRAALSGDLDAAAAATARFRLGEELYTTRSYAAAIVELTEFVDAHRDHAALPRALHYLGEAAYAEHDYATAERALAWHAAMFADDPLAERTRLLQTCCLMQLGRPAAAWTVLAPIYWQTTEKRDLFVDDLAATLLTTLGRDDEACAAYESLLKQDLGKPRRVAILLQLTELHGINERLDDAARTIASAVESADAEQLPDALNVQAEIAAERGEIDAADDALGRLAKEFPKHALATQAIYRRGDLAVQRGDWNLAAQRFAEVCDRPGVDAEWKTAAWSARLQALAQDRQWGEIIALADEARKQIAAGAGRAEVDYLCGRARLGCAELDTARDEFARCLSVKETQGTEIAALAQFMTGETYFLQRNYEAALAAYRRTAVHEQPHWSAAALLQAAKCSEQLQRPAEAVTTYEALLHDFADSAFVDEARTRLAACTSKSAAKPEPARK
jgi:TolA-binding protein